MNLLDTAKRLYEKGEYEQATIIAKSLAFDGLQGRDYDMLRKAYMLLADLSYDNEMEFAYYQASYETAKFNVEMYIETCFILIERMKKMDSEKVKEFIQYILSSSEGEFKLFLLALYLKLTDKPYSTEGIPVQLTRHIKAF